MALILSFCACDKDDSNINHSEPEPQPEPEQPTVYSEVGVWESGKYFVALSEDHKLSAYVASNSIDGGTYSISDDKVITCNNTYFKRTSTYTIESINEKNMRVRIKYMGYDKTEKDTTLNLTKSDKDAPRMFGPLVGKEYSNQREVSVAFGTITYSFNDDFVGLKMCTKSPACNYPLDVFYVTLEDRCYYFCFNQGERVPSVGGWNDSSIEKLRVFTFIFGDNGEIVELKDVSDKYL